MTQVYKQLGKYTLDALSKYGISGWQPLREALLLAAAKWLWKAGQSACQPLPDLLKRPTGPWQTELDERLAPLLSKVFANQDTWQQLEQFARLSEQAAPAIIRRQAGIYYTPGAVAAFVIRRAFHFLEWEPDKILRQVQNYLDPACGSGLFLWQVFAQISLHISDPALLADWICHAYGCDLDELALSVVDFGFALYWQRNFPDLTRPKPHLACLNALEATPDGQLLLLQFFPDLTNNLSLLISNPPYVGERRNKALFLPLQKEPWASDYRGRGDLYYYFFFLALKLSRPETVNALLTPSYFRTATGAAHLRETLCNQSQILEVVDFGNLRLFPAAAGHHSQLTLFRESQLKQTSLARVQQFQGKAGSRLGIDAQLNELELGQNAVFQPHANLFQGPERVLVWQKSQFEEILSRMVASPLRLAQSFAVRQGIVSGADSLSENQQKRWQIQHPPGSGIFVLNQFEMQALNLADSQDWIQPWFKNSDVHAWQAQTTPEFWLIYAHRQRKTLPTSLEAHLLPFKPLLEQRREVQMGRIPWWHLQWPRDPELFLGPKLVLPQRANVGLAAYVKEPWYASADVYFIVQPQASWSLEALCTLLNSPLYTFWWYHRGKRKGNLLELYQHPLSETPLPTNADIQSLETLFSQAHQLIQHVSDQTPEASKSDPVQLAFELHLHEIVCVQYGLDPQQMSEVWSWYQNHKGN